MEHPLISNIDHMTLEDLQSRINDLHKKLNYAIRSGNADLRSQIQLALNTFNNKYKEKQQALWNEKNKNNPDWSDKINIS